MGIEDRAMTDLKQNKTLDASRLLGKGFFTMLVLAIAGFLLIACGSSDVDDAASEEPNIQMVYQDWNTEWFPPMAQEMLEEFHKTNPGIRQLMVDRATFRSVTRDWTSRRRAGSSGTRCLRQQRDRTLNSISAIFSQLPCLGV